MKEEKQGLKTNKAKEALDKKPNSKRMDFLVTYEVEGSRSKNQKAHAYTKEEAEEIVTKRLKAQISAGEINGFKIISVNVENPK